MKKVEISLEKITLVDHFINAHTSQDERLDGLMRAVLERCHLANLPRIHVPPNQGKLLYLLAKLKAAKRILEIGTLGAYSSIWMGLALPEGGELITLDFDENYIAVAQDNINFAGLQDKITLISGQATDSLQDLITQKVQPFDFIFIDADKENNPQYLALVLQLSKSSTVLIADNVVRAGRILEEQAKASNINGLRQFFQEISNNPRLEATAIQTVGEKNWDGFLMAIVK